MPSSKKTAPRHSSDTPYGYKHLQKTGLLVIIASIVVGCFTTTDYSSLILSLTATGSLMGAALYFISSTSSTKLSINPPAILLGLFGLFLLGNIWGSAIPYFSLTSFAIYAVMPFTAFILLLNGHSLAQHTGFIIRSLIIAFSPFAVWALIQFFCFSDLFAHQASHPLPNANALGAIFNVMSLLCLGQFYKSEIRLNAYKHWFYAGLFILFIAGLMATGSRGALLAMLCGLICFFLLSAPSQKLRLLPGLAFGSIGYGLFLYLNQKAAGQVSLMYSRALHGRSYDERWMIWQEAWEMAKDAPLYGYGMGTYSAILPAYRSIYNESAGLNAHNDYLHMLVEIGPVGLALYALILFYSAFFIMRYMTSLYFSKHADFIPISPKHTVLLAGVISATIVILLQGAVTSLMLAAPIGILLALLGSVFLGRPSKLKTTYFQLPASITKKSLGIFAIILSIFITLPQASNFYLEKAQDALIAQDIPAFDKALKTADKLSYQTNANVFLASSTLPFSMLTSSASWQLPPYQKDELKDRIEQLYTKSLSLNPYMPVIWYQRGLIAAQEKNHPKATEFFMTTLRIDPGFLPARMDLAQLQKDQGLIDSHKKTLMGGFYWHYWRFDPTSYYRKIERLLNTDASADDNQRQYLIDKIENAEARKKRGEKIDKLFDF